MRILVTGGNGFLGKHIIKQLLKKKYTVRSFHRSSAPELEALGVEVIEGDITRASDLIPACSGIDAIIHTAAKASIWGPRDGFQAVNLLGTELVVRACQLHKIPYLIHTSTPSVVFNGQAFSGENEALPYGSNWLCHYAETKAKAEQYVLKKNTAQSLKTIALRPHLIWGAGDPHIIPRLINKAQARGLKIIGDGQNKVDITHVENAAWAHILALEALQASHPGGKAYFISDGIPVILWDWINQLFNAIDIPQITKTVSFKKAYRAGQACEYIFKSLGIKKEPPITRFLAIELSKDHYFNSSAAQKDLGYTPIIEPETGLKSLVSSLRR